MSRSTVVEILPNCSLETRAKEGFTKDFEGTIRNYGYPAMSTRTLRMNLRGKEHDNVEYVLEGEKLPQIRKGNYIKGTGDVTDRGEDYPGPRYQIDIIKMRVRSWRGGKAKEFYVKENDNTD